MNESKSNAGMPEKASSLHEVDGSQEEIVETGVSFGDTELGQGLGCASVIVAIGIAGALIAWATH